MKEPEKCYLCGSYNMFHGMYEKIENEMHFVCVECLKKHLNLGPYGFPLEDQE